MDSFVLEKQVATNHEYDWIVTALEGMASAYASKSLNQALEKVQSISHTRDTAVSVDLGVASEDDKINRTHYKNLQRNTNGIWGMKIKLYPKEEARYMLCRYHNLDGAESLCGKKGVEKIMQRIHSIQYDPLNVVVRNADLVLQLSKNELRSSTLQTLIEKNRIEEIQIEGIKEPFYISNKHKKYMKNRATILKTGGGNRKLNQMTK